MASALGTQQVWKDPRHWGSNSKGNWSQWHCVFCTHSPPFYGDEPMVPVYAVYHAARHCFQVEQPNQ